MQESTVVPLSYTFFKLDPREFASIRSLPSRFRPIQIVPRSKSVMVVVDHHEYLCEEEKRLKEDRERTKYWKKWGCYTAERQWATVREDYSHDGDAWSHFSHDQARSRAFRWGEDGIAGVCDTHGYQHVTFAFWNEKDAFLKERLFGLSNPQGNHGESLKEAHFHVDNTPTHCKSASMSFAMQHH